MVPTGCRFIIVSILLSVSGNSSVIGGNKGTWEEFFPLVALFLLSAFSLPFQSKYDHQLEDVLSFGPNLFILVIHISSFILHTFVGIRYSYIKQMLNTLIFLSISFTDTYTKCLLISPF